MLSKWFHIDEGLKAWLKCVGIGAGIGATIGAGIALIALILAGLGIGYLLITLGVPAFVLILIGLLICCIPHGIDFCFGFLESCLLLGALTGGLLGGFGTAVALDVYADEWKKKYCKLICNWIHENYEDGSRTKKFLIEKVSLVSEAMASILRKRKPGFIEAGIIAEKDDGLTIVVSKVEIPLEEVQDSGLSHQQVLLGSKEEFLEMESGL